MIHNESGVLMKDLDETYWKQTREAVSGTTVKISVEGIETDELKTYLRMMTYILRGCGYVEVKN